MDQYFESTRKEPADTEEVELTVQADRLEVNQNKTGGTAKADDGHAEEEIIQVTKEVHIDAKKKKTTTAAEKTKGTKKPARTTQTKEGKVSIKMSEQERKEYELMRRWLVKIMNIKVQNTQKEPIDCFLQFIIGGNFGEDEVTSTTGKKEVKIVGEFGPNFQTENLKYVEKDKWRAVNAKFEGEYRGSYLMLEDEPLTIEVWKQRNWTINEFVGNLTIPLADISNANINRTDEIVKESKDGGLKGFMRVSYTLYFQEIWDWNISYTDWKCINLRSPDGPDIQPRLNLTLLSSGHPSLSVKYNKVERNPHWETIKDSMYYRGTIDELENQQLRVDIIDDSGPIPKNFASRIVNMKGVVDFGKIKTSINLGPPKSTRKAAEAAAKKKEEEEKKAAAEGGILGEVGIKPTKTGEEEEEEDIFANESIIVDVEGRVDVGAIPKYRQRGELTELRSDKQYLLVNLLKVEKINPPESVATPNTFVTIEWGGQIKRTATINDSYQPVFNQLFAFKLPLKKQIEKILRKMARGVDKKESSKVTETIRNEIAPNNNIVFDLWLESPDGSNDNLGSCTFMLSDLEKCEAERGVYRDSKTKKDVAYTSRTCQTQKKLVSGKDESGTGQILFEVWFLPDLKTVNLEEFSKLKKDRLPDRIGEKEYNDIKKVWMEGISRSFTKTLDKLRLRNFNTLEVKDQYAKTHFISMYLGKFTMNTFELEKEGIHPDEISALEEERRVETLGELAHFCRCIPYQADAASDIWYSPNFLTTRKKGSVLDHTLFMACLFMSCKHETKEDWQIHMDEHKKKGNLVTNFIPKIKDNTHHDKSMMDMEYRTFVCIGTHKYLKTKYSWVMTLDADLRGVTFWDAADNKKYNLRGRILEPQKLRMYLKDEKVEGHHEGRSNLLNIGAGKLGKGIKKFGNLGRKMLEASDSDEEKAGKERETKDKKSSKKRNKESKVTEEDQPDDEDLDEKILGAEDDEIYQDRKVDRQTLGAKKSVRFTGPAFLKNLRQQYAEDGTDMKESIGGTVGNHNFLENERAANIEKEKSGTAKRLRAVEDFQDDDGLRVTPITLPFSSLELIFNNQNIWANLQHQDPNSIYYNIYDENVWRPVLRYKEAGKDVSWKGKLGIFYNFNNLRPPTDQRGLKKLKEEIIRAVNFEIESARSGSNLPTKWKHPSDKVVEHLTKYLRLLEFRDTEKYDRDEFNEEKSKWEEEMKKKMPENWRYNSLPMFFAYSEPEKIKSVVRAQTAAFFMTKEKQAIFALGCKIFPYPGGFNSVRIFLAYFTPIPLEELDEDEESDKSRTEDDVDLENLGPIEEHQGLIEATEI